MRTPEQLLEDQRRLRICAELEKALESVQRTFPRMTLREAAAQLPPNTTTNVLRLADEVKLWSQEVHAP